MGNRFEEAIHVAKTGIVITTGAASAGSALPTDSAGNIPRYVRIAASSAANVRLGKTAATAVATDLQVQPGDAVILSVSGFDYVAAIQVTVAGVVQVSPLENC